MATPARIALLVVSLAAGCGAPGPYVVHDPPLLALQRDHYVLPPDPPPAAWSDLDRRALEAEWPPVDALSIPPPPPPDGPVRVRPRLGRPRPLIPPRSSSRAPGPAVHGLPRVDGVILRAAPGPAGGPARVVLILEPR